MSKKFESNVTLGIGKWTKKSTVENSIGLNQRAYTTLRLQFAKNFFPTKLNSISPERSAIDIFGIFFLLSYRLELKEIAKASKYIF